jgi:hypothetical protein
MLHGRQDREKRLRQREDTETCYTATYLDRLHGRQDRVTIRERLRQATYERDLDRLHTRET